MTPSKKIVRTCPWCGEAIKSAAIVCRFCHNEVTDRGMKAAAELISGATPMKIVQQPETPLATAQPTDDPALNRLSSFVPASLLQSIIETADAIEEGERRPLSVLFSDLCGFTALTSELGAETMADLLNEIYSGIRAAVKKYGGAVEKFIGDEVMALFGAPTAHGDDPERAIRAALEIRQTVQAIGRARGLKLDTHAGVAYGEVVFKSYRGEGRIDFNTIGDTVNLASRLQGVAQAGETVVDHRVYLQARTTFDWRHLPNLDIKGRRDPLQAHCVTAVRKEFAKVVLGERIEMAPMVGRRADLNRLLKTADGVAENKRGRVALVRGDGGIGKSRLVYEFYRKLPKDRFRWFTGRCLSFGAHIPWLPFQKLAQAILGIGERPEEVFSAADLRRAVAARFDPARRRARSTAGRKRLKDAQGRVTHALELLFAKHGTKNPLLSLDPKERRTAIYDAFVELIERVAAEAPTVLVFEDFHWADEESFQLLDHLTTQLASAPVLILVIARPEMEHEFPNEGDFVRVDLEELSERDSRTLLCRLLGLDRVAPHLRERILKRVQGNPFFLEEIILDLEERGTLVRKRGRLRLEGPVESIDIPDTVEGLVLARLDRLQASLKRVLQCASVVGQEFRYETLAHIEDVTRRLHEHLVGLVDNEYVFERSLVPELSYIFRHLILRDVAYGTLLESRRRYFHSRVAQIIEELFAEHLHEHLELLAHHYEKGGVADKALDYLERAAVKCEGVYALHAAADHWRRLLVVVDGMREVDETTQRLRMRANLRLEELCRRLGDAPAAVRADRAALEDAEALGDEPAAIEALMGLSDAHRLTGRPARGLRAVQDAVARARALGDPRWIALSVNFLGHFERMRGRFDEADAAFTEALELARAAGDRNRQYQALNHLGIVAMAQGRPREANQRFETALELAREMKRKAEIAQITLNLGINHLRLGECDAARKHLARAAVQSEKIEFEYGRALALAALVDLAVKTGRFAHALKQSRALLSDLRETPFRDVEAVARLNHARALLASGQAGQARRELDRAARMASEDGNYIAEMDALGVRAECLLADDDYAAALATADEMRTVARRHKDREFLAMAETLCARAELLLGRADDARRTARRAIRMARQALLPRDEGWALLTLAQCDAAAGRRQAARKSLEQARHIGQRIDDAALIAGVEDRMTIQ